MLLAGCFGTFTPKEYPKLEFKETPPYELDLSTIPKPEKIAPIFARQLSDGKYAVTSSDRSTCVILNKEEYKKVLALLAIATTYKKIIVEQTELVNIKISINNALKEYLTLEQAKAEEYRILWADSENSYRREKAAHKIDTVLNRILEMVLAGAIIAVVAL